MNTPTHNPPTAPRDDGGTDEEGDYEGYLQWERARRRAMADDAVRGTGRNDPWCALYKCEDCAMPASCASCTVQAHTYTPFHRTRLWNGEYFEQWAMWRMGYVFSPRHPGSRCPNVGAHKTTRPLTVVDIMGYTTVLVEYCRCRAMSPGKHEHADQLLEAQLWPATLEDPRTAFRFRLLDNFIMHNNTDKKSAYNFCWGLRRLTDPLDPHAVSVSRRWLASLRLLTTLTERV